ncbi:hypothetical protein D3C86_1694390 [compost metagenome]
MLQRKLQRHQGAHRMTHDMGTIDLQMVEQLQQLRGEIRELHAFGRQLAFTMAQHVVGQHTVLLRQRRELRLPGPLVHAHAMDEHDGAARALVRAMDLKGRAFEAPALHRLRRFHWSPARRDPGNGRQCGGGDGRQSTRPARPRSHSGRAHH